MNRYFRNNLVEISGVRTIEGGGTNASNAGQALLNLSGVSITGNQTISGVKTFINTARVDSVNFTRNFITTGTPYNFSTSGVVINDGPYEFVTHIYTGWNNAIINPSDDNRSIKLSSGSYINITVSGRNNPDVQVAWFAIKNTGDSNPIQFNLLNSGVPVNFIRFGGFSVFNFSGFLPREYDRIAIGVLGSNLFPLITVSGDFGIQNEIILESRNNRLFLGNSGVLFGGEAVAPLVDINNIITNFNFSGPYNSKLLTINASQNITGTVPTGLSTGYNVAFVQMGAGQLRITGQNGVTIRQRLNLYNTAGQYAIASLVHRGNNEYILYGDLA
jgi:hypothetical protein